jgi:uncharacterized membrane-anchored protein YitT (DUF2179 family)
MQGATAKKSIFHWLSTFFWMAIGSLIYAVAIKILLPPFQLIDGGIVGISMICAYIFGSKTLSFFLVVLNLPFIVLAYRQIGRTFVLLMVLALAMLSFFCWLLGNAPPFEGDVLEVIVFGGLFLGIGVGLVIRMGGAFDGTEILAILVNRKYGFTVGQVVFFFNIFIFAAAGIVYQDWHSALRSFMTYIVAYKIMDAVIVGLEEMKSVTIISEEPRRLADLLIHELGLGVTIMYGRGGYSGAEQEIIYVIAERLQLAELKNLVHREDPNAFLAIENLHEVVSGRQGVHATRKSKKRQELS